MAGFTLVELMIVVVIVGLAASVTAPTVITQMSRYRLQGAAAQMAWNFRTLRMQAISQRRPITVTFTSEHAYAVWVDRNNNGMQDTGEVQNKSLNTSYGDVRFTTTQHPTFQPTGLVNNGPTVTLTGAGG